MPQLLCCKIGNNSCLGIFKVGFLPCHKDDPEVVRPVCNYIRTVQKTQWSYTITVQLYTCTSSEEYLFLPRMWGKVCLLDCGNQGLRSAAIILEARQFSVGIMELNCKSPDYF